MKHGVYCNVNLCNGCYVCVDLHHGFCCTLVKLQISAVSKRESIHCDCKFSRRNRRISLQLYAKIEVISIFNITPHYNTKLQCANYKKMSTGAVKKSLHIKINEMNG